MADNNEKPKVTLYWLNQSRAQRTLWLLEECSGLDYTIEVFKRQQMMAPPELKKIHPLGKSPVISVQAPGRSEPILIAESGFIHEYLTENFAPHLMPKKYQDGKENKVGGETESWLRYRYFMHYTEGSFMGLLVTKLLFDTLKTRSPFFLKPLTSAIAGQIESAYLGPNFKTHFGFLESQLATSPDDGQYLCGPNLTSADILMSFPLIEGKKIVTDNGDFPKLKAYIERMEGNEVYQRSIKVIEEKTGEKVKAAL